MRIGNILYFSPNFRFVDLDWSDSGKLLQAFEDRITGFYLRPAEKLCKDGDGFACGVLCVTAIDFMARIQTGDESTGARIKNWLSSQIPEFSRNCDNCGTSCAELFYLNFRNGLVHEGRIKKLGQFSYDEKRIVSIGNGVMLVNPALLLLEIKKAFSRYLECLRKDKHTFLEFKKNLMKDFGEVTRAKSV